MRKNTQESKRFNLYLKVANHRTAKSEAAKKGMTVSDLVDQLIEKYVKELK